MNASRRARRLDVVADLARHRRQAAERALADSRRELQRRRDMLGQLQTFRDEYDTGPGRASAAGRSVCALRDYERFCQRLETLIGEQQRELREAEAVVAGLQRALAEASRRAESLDMAVSRYRALASREEGRREQRLLDEIASLAAARR